MTKELNPGDIVIHKLTKDKMIVLDSSGYGISNLHQTLVRLSNLSTIWVNRAEIFYLNPNCKIHNYQLSSGPLGPGPLEIKCTCED